MGYDQHWPPTVQQLKEYIAFLSQNGYAHRTVVCHIAAIALTCNINGLTDTTQGFVIRNMLEGMKRLQTRIDERRPISLELLNSITSNLHLVCNSDYETKLFETAFQLAFFGLLRVSELNFSKNDINIFPYCVKLYLASSKTDQFRNGTTIKTYSKVTLIERTE